MDAVRRRPARARPGQPVRRIDLVVATDMLPNAYRFFVDDLQLR
ncbi:hypothetical protein [Dactylosporangium cerinum]